jgi:hypothetical protein
MADQDDRRLTMLTQHFLQLRDLTGKGSLRLQRLKRPAIAGQLARHGGDAARCPRTTMDHGHSEWRITVGTDIEQANPLLPSKTTLDVLVQGRVLLSPRRVSRRV